MKLTATLIALFACTASLALPLNTMEDISSLDKRGGGQSTMNTAKIGSKLAGKATTKAQQQIGSKGAEFGAGRVTSEYNQKSGAKGMAFVGTALDGGKNRHAPPNQAYKELRAKGPKQYSGNNPPKANPQAPVNFKSVTDGLNLR